MNERKFLVLACLLLFSLSVFAATPEQALEKYYSSSHAENLEEHFSVVYTEGMSGEEIEAYSEIIEMTWDEIEIHSYSINNAEAILSDSEDEALIKYNLDLDYTVDSGERLAVEGIPYIAYLIKTSDWQIAFAMPASDYLELKSQVIEVEAIESFFEHKIEQAQNTEKIELTVNDEVPERVPLPPDIGNGNGGDNNTPWVPGLFDIIIYVVIAIIIVAAIVSFAKKKK
ncbi:MAG: hypothetical protein JW772_04680 [Candidatus Diapherotrites archaeon]|nr:hypothetical protein [Candidatus Diapherotrites archaeon]